MTFEDFKRKFGINIKHYRLLHNYTQNTFAEKVGISETYLSLIENGHKNISIKTLFKLSEALEISVSKLFKFDD